MTSRAPKTNMRPAERRTWGRSWNASGATPRTVRLAKPGFPIYGRLMISTTSRETRGFPPELVSTSGSVAVTAACSRLMMLLISALAAFRSTMKLSSDPVATRARWSPWAIISTAAKTKTTRAIEAVVLRLAVGDSNPGMRPRRFEVRM